MTTDPVLVLSGGGNLGAAQVGVLQALLRGGVRPSAVVGSSVGALNAVALAVDPTPARVDEMSGWWRAVRSRDVFAGDRRLGVLRLATGRGSLHVPSGLRALVERFCTVDDLADTAVPLHVATTELAAGRTRWWRAGDPVPILLASCAIPVVFPPVVLDGELHVDGALIEPVGLRRAVSTSAAPVIVIDTGATALPLGPVESATAAVTSAIRAGRLARLTEDREQVDPTRVRWVSVDLPPLAYDDFSRTEELIELGRRAGERFLAETDPASDQPLDRMVLGWGHG